MAQKFPICVRKSFTYIFFSDRNQRASFNVKVKRGQKNKKKKIREEERKEKKKDRKGKEWKGKEREKKIIETYIPCYF